MVLGIPAIKREKNCTFWRALVPPTIFFILLYIVYMVISYIFHLASFSQKFLYSVGGTSKSTTSMIFFTFLHILKKFAPFQQSFVKSHKSSFYGFTPPPPPALWKYMENTYFIGIYTLVERFLHFLEKYREKFTSRRFSKKMGKSWSWGFLLLKVKKTALFSEL